MKQIKKIIPIFVPHRGCPHDCIFCNQKKITGISTDVTASIAEEIIKRDLETIPKNADVEIAFFGGSFTAIEKDIQKSLLGVAKKYKDAGFVQNIRLSTRPDCIDDGILDILCEYGVTIIELGVQSLDEDVLNKSLRGHSAQAVYTSSQKIKERGINLGLQMMLGLPGDTEEKSIYTAKKFLELEPFCVRVYPTLVIKETGLEKELLNGNYNALNVDNCVNITKKILALFGSKKINVIRVGLQPTEEIQLGVDVVAGPYHPAFREITYSEMIKDYIEYMFKKELLKQETNKLEVYTNNRNISKIIGNKKSNKLYFKEKYNVNLVTNIFKEDKFKVVFGEKEIYFDMFEIYNELCQIYKIL